MKLQFAYYTRKCLKKLARPERFELPTAWFVAGFLEGSLKLLHQ